MVEFVSAADVLLFAPDESPERVALLVREVTALATVRVPGLAEVTDPVKITAVGAVLRGAVQRALETGAAGATTRQETTGPFSVMETFESAGKRGGLLWPSEIDALAEIVAGAGVREAFTIETVPETVGAIHSPWCDIYFSRWPCSCMSIINAGTGPLYEDGLLSPGGP